MNANENSIEYHRLDWLIHNVILDMNQVELFE